MSLRHLVVRLSSNNSFEVLLMPERRATKGFTTLLVKGLRSEEDQIAIADCQLVEVAVQLLLADQPWSAIGLQRRYWAILPLIAQLYQSHNKSS